MSKLKLQQKIDAAAWRNFPLIDEARARDATLVSLLSDGRLRAIARYLRQVPASGDTAEIGIANGGTSALIALSNGGRPHWACDTFAGLVDVSKEDEALKNGMFAKGTAYATVRGRLAGIVNVRIVAGRFPQSSPSEMQEARFAFVHLDVDTYASTLAGFAFFEPRMMPGGIMAIDDALTGRAPGAQKAWAEIKGNPGRWELIGETEQQAGLRFK